MSAFVGKPQFSSRLSVRFAVILALALLPAGFVGFVQTESLQDEIQARSEVALMGATLQAAVAETGLIRRVQGMVASLSNIAPSVINDPAACVDLMRRVAVAEPSASLTAFVPVSGLMSCNSLGRVHDFSDNPLFQQTIQAKAPFFVVNPNGPLSGTSILGISHPVYDAMGVYLGYVVMSVPHNALANLRLEEFDAQTEIPDPLVFWTFDANGQVLTSNFELEIAKTQLPGDQSLAQHAGNDSHIFRTVSVSGREMTYAVVPLVPGSLYLMGSFLTGSDGAAFDVGLSPYLPTFLMWVVGLIVSGLAAELLVTRHVRTLNRSIVSFARGDRRLQAIDLKNAPAELEELGSAYLTMTESITRSEADLEDSVHQKEVLLREVHHRVKNNLQLISSIMNIQIRNARSGEAKDLLKNLQERVMSLATVHRGLYQTSGLADVRARELIPAIVRQIMSISQSPEKPFETKVDIDDLRLVPDQAVPLSLLLAEAMTNALKHAGATRDAPGHLSVRLKRLGGSEAVLEVVNSTRTSSEVKAGAGPEDAGMGSQLITAFVQQLGGRRQVAETDGEYSLSVSFAISPLSTAENRLDRRPLDPDEWNPNAT
jgi:two-component system, sensor histidine kinase PdtaS